MKKNKNGQKDRLTPTLQVFLIDFLGIHVKDELIIISQN